MQKQIDIDPHLILAAKKLKIPYVQALRRFRAEDEEVVRARKRAKYENFWSPLSKR
jgi:hypothetical protein